MEAPQTIFETILMIGLAIACALFFLLVLSLFSSVAGSAISVEVFRRANKRDFNFSGTAPKPEELKKGFEWVGTVTFKYYSDTRAVCVAHRSLDYFAVYKATRELAQKADDETDSHINPEGIKYCFQYRMLANCSIHWNIQQRKITYWARIFNSYLKAA